MDNPKKDAGEAEMLPPPPPVVPPNFVPQKVGNRVPMTRRGVATTGTSITVKVNHFKVAYKRANYGTEFQHHSVAIKYEDGSPIEVKTAIWRKILNKLLETFAPFRNFAYDGHTSLFTAGLFPAQADRDFIVELDDETTQNRNIGSGSPGADGSPNDTDRKRLRREHASKTYTVSLKFTASIPIEALGYGPIPVRGIYSEHFQEAVRVLNIILRYHAAQRGCFLVRQSFFHNNDRNFVDLGGGVLLCRGFHSSIRPTQGGLSLNMDISTTMIVKPGPLLDFLLFNQEVDGAAQLDWIKAKKTLRNLRVKVSSSNMEYKISGLSDLRCREQTFLFKQRSGASEAQENEITVYNYFTQHRKIELEYSAEMPCVNVGKPKRPTYFPVELCSLVPLQRYTKSLSNRQRASLVEKSRLRPKDIVLALERGPTTKDYVADPFIRSCEVRISTKLTQVQGRVLAPPKLRVGSREDLSPRTGRWNFNQKFIAEPCGMFDERPQSRSNPAPIRVDEMIGMIKPKLHEELQFLLCILPEKKNSDLYGPWKKACLCELGVVTQCIAPTLINDQYLTNVLLKINAKLGGLNSILTMEYSAPKDAPSYSVYNVCTLIVGMDVSHGSPGRDAPSVVAVVSSRQWPLISKYRATVRFQPAKSEIIEGLFKPVSDTEDEGIFRELLTDFIKSSNRKPDQIIIFRDGVSESQFNQVLNVELEQIIQACKFLDEKWSPKFMLVVAQKNHHTKIFQAKSDDNVPPGTVIDNEICHPTSNDFYMCAHAGMIGTTRPTHYHVLHDELGYSPDDFQELVHSLSYVYQRSTTAISVVAPIRYAHLAAAQVSQFIKLDEFSDQSSSHSGGPPSVPELPTLHKNVCNSMFFC